MTLETLISNYGPLAVFLGAGFEGETAVFLGGVFAHRQLFPFWQAALAAVLGSFLVDQAWFFAGRHAHRLAFVQRLLKTPAAARVHGLLNAHPTAFILGFRFIYGMRTVSPIAIGLTSVSAVRFVMLNFIAAVVWGVAISAIGYLFGNAVEALFGRLRLHLHLLIALGVVLVGIGLLAFLLHRHWRKAGADKP